MTVDLKAYKYKYCYGFRDHHWQPSVPERTKEGNYIIEQCDGCRSWRWRTYSRITNEPVGNWSYEWNPEYSPQKNIEEPVTRDDVRGAWFDENLPKRKPRNNGG